jgi:putative transposase
LKGDEKMKATRVEQQVIRKNHPMWKMIDHMCFNSKNLYNYANYIIRQEFINNDKYINYYDMNKNLKTAIDYKSCMSQPANCTLRLLDKNWKSFFVAIKDWQKHPEKYLGKPKLPKYLKKDGRFIWMIPNNTCFLNDDGTIHFAIKRLQGYNWKTHAQGRLIQIRFVPHGDNYIMEVVTEIEIPDFQDVQSNRIASIDLGVNNFVTLTNNIGVDPIIINGRGIKSINQYFNKQRADIQSDLIKRNNQHWSHKLDSITFKRNNRVKNFIHHVSKYVVNWCIENQIDTLVCGYNPTWKQDSELSKRANQNFIQIPYNMLIQQLTYKCEAVGIKFVTTDESYTSGTSFLDGELPCKENYNKSRRIHRGMFQASDRLINSDVNGSLQIMRKVFPDAFSYGIEGNLTPTIINVMKVA